MTILKTIRQLYSKTIEQCDKNSAALSFLVGGGDEDETYTISDSDTNTIVSLDYSNDAKNVLMSIVQGSQTLVDRYVIPAPDAITMQDNIDEALELEGLSNQITSDKLINNTCQAATFYELISDITHGFIVNTRQDASTVIGVIESKANLSLDDREKLVGMVQAAQDNGQLSNYGWLSILNSIYQNTSDAAQGSSTLEIVDGSPYILRSVAQVVITIIETVIETVIQILLSICSVFLRIVGIVFYAVKNLIQSALNTSISVNMDDHTNYVMGSPIVKTFERQQGDHLGIQYDTRYDDYVYFQPVGNGIVQTAPGVEMYCWMPKNNAVVINGRLCVNVDPERLHTYISRRVSYIAIEGNTGIKCTITTPLFPIIFNNDDENFFLSQEEIVKSKSDMEYAGQAMMASMCALGLALFKTNGEICLKQPDYGSVHNNYTIYDLAAFCMYYGYFANYDTFSAQNKVTEYRSMWYAINSAAQNMVINLFSDDDEITATIANPLGSCFSVQTVYSYDLPMDIFHRWLGCEYNGVGVTGNLLFVKQYNNNFDDPIIVDAVPKSYGFTPAQFSVDEIVTAVTTIATITTAAFVAGNLVKKAIRHKRRIKQLNMAKNLDQTRSAYMNDPSKTNAIALNKAVDKYNRQGKMFGWDEYDVTNNWYTPRSSLGATGTANLFYGMDAADTTSNYIIQLLTGRNAR